MKVVAPSELVAEAAAVVAPFWEEVVVIGAAALQMVLADDVGGAEVSDGSSPEVRVTPTRDLGVVIVTPTRDVDLVVKTERAADIVRQLEDAGLEPSQEPYERGFTWIRADLKIQLLRSFHPFPSGGAETMPQHAALSLLDDAVHTMDVAFQDAPDVPRLRCATAAALVAVKQAAFGRSRADGEPVERDFHDVYLIIDQRPADLESSYRAATLAVRPRVDHSLAALAEGGGATQAAARQHALITGDENRRDHELAIRRSAIFQTKAGHSRRSRRGAHARAMRRPAEESGCHGVSEQSDLHPEVVAFANWFADWWLRRGRDLYDAAEAGGQLKPSAAPQRCLRLDEDGRLVLVDQRPRTPSRSVDETPVV